MATWIWIALLVIGLGFEAYTIWGDKLPRTTLSAHVWALRARPFTRGLLVAAFAWLIYHFFFETPVCGGESADDWFIVATAFFATLVRNDLKVNVR